MEQPNAQSQPAATSTTSGAPIPGRRDMMFCHECHDEWYRDEHGLTCPECHSDFTEIIEDGNDPRDASPEDGEDNDSMPDLQTAPPPLHPLHDHNPWHMHGDPDEDDISNVRWRQLGPGRYAVSATRTISPMPGGGIDASAALGPFAGLLNTIIGGAVGMGPTPDSETHGSQDAPEGGTRGRGEGVTAGGHRFTYNSNVTLEPRNTNEGPQLNPHDELDNVLVGLMASFGGAHAHHHHHPHHEFGGADDPDNPRGNPLNPILSIFSQFMPGMGSGQVGDFVYSQEALDRIVTQVMEQTATSSAPGPASQSDIESLARKDVTVEMLGNEGRAECSICMDEVNIGEQVTELPCHHWFHHACVAAWLAEHDTCPHCRKGISKNSADTSQVDSGARSADPASQMPGSFTTAGETSTDLSVAHDASSQSQPQQPGQVPRQPGQVDSGAGSAEESEGAGFSDRIRRGLFGPPR